VLVIDGALTLLAAGGIRFSVRLSATRQRGHADGNGRRVLVAGAGDAGAMVAREMQRNLQLGLIPFAFVDDDPAKQQMRIHGLPVMGTHESIPQVVSMLAIDQVIIAMPTAPGQIIRQIVEACEQMDVKTKIVPGIYELLDGTVSVSQLRNVEIEDLLRREPVQTDIEAVQAKCGNRGPLATGTGPDGHRGRAGGRCRATCLNHRWRRLNWR
jgi:FlaA1/EpsC-like NDP-sugar epimerase